MLAGNFWAGRIHFKKNICVSNLCSGRRLSSAKLSLFSISDVASGWPDCSHSQSAAQISATGLQPGGVIGRRLFSGNCYPFSVSDFESEVVHICLNLSLEFSPDYALFLIQCVGLIIGKSPAIVIPRMDCLNLRFVYIAIYQS